jgi:lipoate-protein ligase A
MLNNSLSCCKDKPWGSEEKMFLFDLGKLSGQQSMLIFHALARMGIEALVIVSPKIPLVSIGYFQDAEQEVDLQYCRESQSPLCEERSEEEQPI